MVKAYMIPVYSLLVKVGRREIHLYRKFIGFL
ncbi:CD1375 family protein [Brevibacillus laterosporus]|nr:CD1375 family protein [Brevibacillus laterosporus]